MAAEILINPSAVHKPHHDLESAFYGFLYLCGMFEGPCDQQRKDYIPSFLNDWMQSHERTAETIGYAKQGWLSQSESMTLASLAQFPSYMHPFFPLILELKKTLSNPEDRSQVTHENWIAIIKAFLSRTTFDDDSFPVPQYTEPPPAIPSQYAPRNIPSPWSPQTSTEDAATIPTALPVVDAAPLHDEAEVTALPVLDAPLSAVDVQSRVGKFQKLHRNVTFASLEESLQPSPDDGSAAISNVGLAKPRRTRLLANLEFGKPASGLGIPVVVQKTQAGRAEVVHPVPSDRNAADALLNYLVVKQPTKNLRLPAVDASDALSRGSLALKPLKALRKTSAPPSFSASNQVQIGRAHV